MSCYEALAGFYDRLTEDVDYTRFADWYERVFRADGGEFHLLLDLCCGTGSLSLEMSERGYELISVDASEQMLMEAREKCSSLPLPPLFLLPTGGLHPPLRCGGRLGRPLCVSKRQQKKHCRVHR